MDFRREERVQSFSTVRRASFHPPASRSLLLTLAKNGTGTPYLEGPVFGVGDFRFKPLDPSPRPDYMPHPRRTILSRPWVTFRVALRVSTISLALRTICPMS